MKTFSDFFGFKKEPFKRAPDIGFYYNSQMYANVLDSLVYLLHSSSTFAFLTGPQGTGKTITLKKFISELPANVCIAYISFPNLCFEELLHLILEEFGIKTETNDRNELLDLFGAFVAEAAENGRQVLIVIDDAQNFPYDTLSGIFLLPRMKGVNEDTLKIVISGRTGLEAKLASEELKGLCGDISAVLKLGNMGEQEIRDYINVRITRAGQSQIKINKNIIKKVATITKGNPQLVNALMERAIIAAFLDNSHTITDQHLTGAIASVNTIMTVIKKNRSRKYLYAATAACAAGVVFAVTYFGVGQYTKNEPTIVAVTEIPKAAPNARPFVNETPAENIKPQEIPPAPVVVVPEPVVVPERPPEPVVVPEPVAVPERQPEPIPSTPVPEVQENIINPMPVGSTIVVTSSSLNIRVMPTTDAERIGAVLAGDELTVWEDTPEWVRVEISEGVYGWLFKRYIRLK